MQPECSLASLGWMPHGRIARSSVELTRTPTWTIARVWSTAGRLISEGTGNHSHLVIIGVDGVADLTVSGQHVKLLPRQMLIVPAGTRFTVDYQGLWARCEWYLKNEIPGHSGLGVQIGVPITVSDGYFSLITTLTNVIATTPELGDSDGAGTLLESFAGIIGATLFDAKRIRNELTSAQASVFERARQIIEESHRDPTFSIASLTRTMAVSGTYLHKVFARTGITPRQMLEKRRADTASTLINLAPAGGRGARAEIATRSGFGSTKSMNAALARHGRASTDR